MNIRRQAPLKALLVLPLLAFTGLASSHAFGEESRCEVTGTPERMTVIADNADVSKLLFRIFEVAKHDFTKDSSLKGVVTLRLTDKPFPTVLSVLCEQASLRPQLDPTTGIYSITHDFQPLKSAAPIQQATVPTVVSTKTSIGDQRDVWEALMNGLVQITVEKDPSKARGRDIPGVPNLNVQVEMRIPKGSPIPVVEALQALAAQAHVPIEIASDVTRGLRFRIAGVISNRTLVEALNLLAPTARLEWRVVGNKLIITTGPDFKIYYGESNVPRSAYPPPGTQRVTNPPSHASPNAVAFPK